MRILIALVMTLLAAPIGLSQSTWNGLRFGMSVKQAQDVMAAKGISMVTGDAQTLKSTEDFDLKFPGTVYPFPVIVALRFDSAGLSAVDLRLDVQKYRERKPDIQSDSEAVWLFSSVSYDVLVEKYGKPMKQEDDCSPLPSSPSWATGCSADWRADGQIIDYLVDTISPQKKALIEYRPEPTQL